MTILVTGATGLVGNNIVRLLLEQGKSVRAMVRKNCDSRPLAELDVDVRIGDLEDPTSIEAACQGVSAVIHSAALVHIGWSMLDEARQVNVEGTRNVANAAAAANAKMVHVSSVDALGIGQPDAPADETTPREGKVPCSYVTSKREAEAALQTVIKEKDLHAVIVNPGFMLGPWDWKPSSGKMLLEVIKNRPPISPRGGCSVADVRDVAAGAIAAIEKGRPGENYILGGANLRYLELWQLFAAQAGTRKPFCRMDSLFAAGVGMFGDVVSKFRKREMDVNSGALKMSSQYHYYHSDKAIKELGYTTRPVEESIEDALAWFKEFGYLPGK